jgi:hypothetical protein
MGEVVKMFKDGPLEGKWDQEAESGSGGITKEWDVINCGSGNVKGRGRGEGGNVGIVLLGGGHGGVVNGRGKNGGGNV